MKDGTLGSLIQKVVGLIRESTVALIKTAMVVDYRPPDNAIIPFGRPCTVFMPPSPKGIPRDIEQYLVYFLHHSIMRDCGTKDSGASRGSAKTIVSFGT